QELGRRKSHGHARGRQQSALHPRPGASVLHRTGQGKVVWLPENFQHEKAAKEVALGVRPCNGLRVNDASCGVAYVRLLSLELLSNHRYSGTSLVARH